MELTDFFFLLQDLNHSKIIYVVYFEGLFTKSFVKTETFGLSVDVLQHIPATFSPKVYILSPVGDVFLFV